MNPKPRAARHLLLLTLVAAAPTTAPSLPQYPIPYAPPTVDQVSQVLSRLLTHLQSNAPIRLLNAKNEEIKDFTAPIRGSHFDAGPENKFPPIAYPMGVIYSGLLSATESTGDKKYADFVTTRFQFFADHYKQVQPWTPLHDNPFHALSNPANLDSTGAMSASFIKAQRMKVGPDLTPLIQIAAAFIHTIQQRLPDGTFCRPSPFPQSIWLDDAYMSVPLLAEYGALTNDPAYFNDAAAQLKGFHKHLFVPSLGLFTHAATAANEADHPLHCWGRANGWYIVATVELLELLPESHPDRPALLAILRAHAKGIASAQSGVGLWHQLLDRPDSYLETSCSAMFAYALAKAVNHHWIDPASYAPVAISAWNACATKVDPDGRLADVCIGTNYADDMLYYYHRPATDDIHGYGPLLLAGAEITKLLKNPNFKWDTGPAKPNLLRSPR